MLLTTIHKGFGTSLVLQTIIDDFMLLIFSVMQLELPDMVLGSKDFQDFSLH